MKKMLIVLGALISVSALRAADGVEEIETPFSKKSTRVQPKPVGYTTKEEEKPFEDLPGGVEMLRWLRGVPKIEKEESRPVTAPAKVEDPRKAFFDALHKGDHPTSQSAVREKKAAAKAASEGGTPHYIRKSLAPLAWPVSQERKLKKKLKNIDELHGVMEHAKLLNKNDDSSEDLASMITQALHPIDSANQVLEKMKKRVESKAQALLKLNDSTIMEDHEEYKHLPDLTYYVSAFFIPQRRTLLEKLPTADERITVELDLDSWKPVYNYRGGTPTSSINQSRPHTPIF